MKINIPFMKIVVVFVIAYVVYLTEKSLNICQAICSTPDGIYIAALAFFGSELAMTMTKKIMDKKKKGEQHEC